MTNFTKNLVSLNGLFFRKWVLRPGMGFGSAEKWWAEGRRYRRHNGLDLRFYENGQGQIEKLPVGTKIPLIYPGGILRIIPDFLGVSIFAEHEIRNGRRLFTIYGHLVPEPGIEGRRLDEGAVIGKIGKLTKSPVPAHLHISVALVPPEIPAEKLDWKALDETDGVEFMDPEGILLKA